MDFFSYFHGYVTVITLAVMFKSLISVSSREDTKQFIFNIKKAEKKHCCPHNKVYNISVFLNTDRPCFQKS